MNRTGVNGTFVVLGGFAAAGLIASSVALVGSDHPRDHLRIHGEHNTDAPDPSGRNSAQDGSASSSEESENESSETSPDISDSMKKPLPPKTSEASETSRNPKGYPDKSRSPRGYPDSLMDVDGVEKRGSHVVYIVQKGDTLSDISGKLGVSVDRLAQANSLKNVHLIYTNSALAIPGRVAKASR